MTYILDLNVRTALLDDGHRFLKRLVVMPVLHALAQDVTANVDPDRLQVGLRY